MPRRASLLPLSELHARVGAAIRAQRQARGWTCHQLADHADMSSAYVGAIERGQANVTLDTLHALGAAMNWIVRFGDKEEQREVVVRVRAVLMASRDQIAESLEWLDAFTANPSH